MSKGEIDDYLSKLDEPKRSTPGQLRDMIVAIVPLRNRASHVRIADARARRR